jgi:hypothetical protein
MKLDGGSYDILGICLPTEVPEDIKGAIDMIKEQIMGSGAGAYFSDLNRSSRSIFVSLAMSIVYSILFIYFLSAFGEVIAWICVVILQLALIALGGLGFYAWDLTKKAAEVGGDLE